MVEKFGFVKRMRLNRMRFWVVESHDSRMALSKWRSRQGRAGRRGKPLRTIFDRSRCVPFD
jgi:hypothetical protein